MSRFILLSVFLGTSIILIMFGGLENSSQGQVQECRDWGTKCWTPYEAVHCNYIRNAPNCYIYVKPKFFNKEGMSNLAQHFSKWSPEIRKGVNLELYDDRRIIERFLRSIRHGVFDPGIYRRRGFYKRGGGRETLVYKIDKKGDKEEGIRIK